MEQVRAHSGALIFSTVWWYIEIGIKNLHIKMKHYITFLLVSLILILCQIEITGYIFQFFDLVAGEPPKSILVDPLIDMIFPDKAEEEVIQLE